MYGVSVTHISGAGINQYPLFNHPNQYDIMYQPFQKVYLSCADNVLREDEVFIWEDLEVWGGLLY